MGLHDPKLLNCPFCGGEAKFTECPTGRAGKDAAWSVGCANEDVDCIGYQMVACYSRKAEAANAWNKRAPTQRIRARVRRINPMCESCGVNRSDPPSRMCVGCQAYLEHQR